MTYSRPTASRVGQRLGERLARRRRAEAVVAIRIGDQRRVVPQRHAVRAPVAGERPARQRFARIPLALAEVQQPARRERLAQAADAASPASRRLVGPIAAVFHSSPSMSSIDTNVGSPPIVSRTSPRGQLAIDAVAEREDRLPLLVASTAW